MWAVIHKETGTMIGRCGLSFLENTPEIELGYVFDKSYWNMGLATEASVATLKFGFWQVKLDRIVAMPTADYAYAHPENIASVRVIQKVGMKYENRTYALTEKTKYE